MPLEYISLKEAAAKWRTKPWYIAKACEAGQVPGAAKLGETWIIPADLERPEMHIPKKNQNHVLCNMVATIKTIFIVLQCVVSQILMLL